MFSDLTLTQVLIAVLIVAGVFVCIALIRLLNRASSLLVAVEATTVESQKTLVEVRESVVPILGSLDVTVDALNAELLRVDSIITLFEDASKKVAHTSDTVTGIVNVPMDMVSGLTERVRKAWKVRRAEIADDNARLSDDEYVAVNDSESEL